MIKPGYAVPLTQVMVEISTAWLVIFMEYTEHSCIILYSLNFIIIRHLYSDLDGILNHGDSLELVATFLGLSNLFMIYGESGCLLDGIKAFCRREDTYMHCSSGCLGWNFEIILGLRQECVLSPWLFTKYHTLYGWLNKGDGR